MPQSRVFLPEVRQKIEADTVALLGSVLNQQQGIFSLDTVNSPRAVGDAIQTILARRFGEILGTLATSTSETFARRAMADIAFTDADGAYYVTDVKTHRLDTKFNMPNLTSVERLARFYEDDNNFFVVLMVDYQVDVNHVTITNCTFVPIEALDWQCLTIGALGWGQIQIANSNRVVIAPDYSRRTWMLTLCKALFTFYPREIAKINERIAYFSKVREFWQAKADE